MASFEVSGGYSLQGNIRPQGAKNEALQVICASLLTDQEVIIENIPDIIDVNLLMQLLAESGVRVERIADGTYLFCARDIDPDFTLSANFAQKVSRLRGSVMVMAPLLLRFKKVMLPRPGGDKIGRRRLDTHFLGLSKLGASFQYDSAQACYHIECNKLQGNDILLEEASVTGTANLIMAACMASGPTRIYNAACEPYIQQLCNMLTAMGASIKGIGSNLLHIEGVESLGGCHHRLLPDMIEIGSFIGLAAMTNSEIRIRDVRFDMLGQIPAAFEKMGIIIRLQGDDLIVPRQDIYEISSFIDGSILTISDAPWPGFPPDLLSIMLVVATQARGSVLIHQKMFESRLFFVDRLIDMGAKIILCDPHRATVIGLERKTRLKALQMVSPDIRAGVALLIAALSADGTSLIHHIDQIDRGYQQIDRRLQALGARIRRIA